MRDCNRRGPRAIRSNKCRLSVKLRSSVEVGVSFTSPHSGHRVPVLPFHLQIASTQVVAKAIWHHSGNGNMPFAQTTELAARKTMLDWTSSSTENFGWWFPARDQKGTRCARVCACNAAAAPATVSGEPTVDLPLGNSFLGR
jgi:hypothetical protein